MKRNIGYFDKEGNEGDVYWEIRQQTFNHFRIYAKNLRKGFVHTENYTLVVDPVTGIDVDDLAEIDALVKKAIRIAHTGKIDE